MLQLQLSGTPYLLTSAQPLSLKDSLYLENLKTNLFNQMFRLPSKNFLLFDLLI